MNPRNLPGLKQRDLTACAVCGKGVMHDGTPTFYRIQIEHYVVDIRAVQRQCGLEQMLGGAAALAQVMGPDDDMAKRAYAGTAIVCQPCSLKPDLCLAHLAECVDETNGGEPCA